jgi:hypothetical protein
MLTRQQLYDIYHKGPQAVVQFMENLLDEIAKQECLVYELTRRLQQASKALAETHQASERQARDSHNSHLPPSSDLPAARFANAARLRIGAAAEATTRRPAERPDLGDAA